MPNANLSKMLEEKTGLIGWEQADPGFTSEPEEDEEFLESLDRSPDASYWYVRDHLIARAMKVYDHYYIRFYNKDGTVDASKNTISVNLRKDHNSYYQD